MVRAGGSSGHVFYVSGIALAGLQAGAKESGWFMQHRTALAVDEHAGLRGALAFESVEFDGVGGMVHNGFATAPENIPEAPNTIGAFFFGFF